MNTQQLIWKSIPGYEGLYEASNHGEIRSEDIINTRGQRRKGRVLKHRLSNGYRRVKLYVNGTSKHYYVHRLIAITFLPNENDYPVINHKDGDKNNNNESNLEWCTYNHNMQHAYDNKLRSGKKGSTNATAKISEDDIPNIRLRLANGDRQVDIAREYGVYQGAISDIKLGKTWTHV